MSALFTLFWINGKAHPANPKTADKGPGREEDVRENHEMLQPAILLRPDKGDLVSGS